jgi:putative flippase GtrA
MKLSSQFFRFSLIGGAGFVVDVAVLYLARHLGLDLYIARLVSFTAAATFTWAGNRLFTFNSDSSPARELGREWGVYLMAMALGGGVNYGTYAALITWIPLLYEQPWLAVAGGTAAGLLINFFLARRILYRTGS